MLSCIASIKLFSISIISLSGCYYNCVVKFMFIKRKIAPLQCATFVGTVTYMSPERIRNESYSYPADIWSLGLALLECGTGEFPYTANEGPVNLMLQVCVQYILKLFVFFCLFERKCLFEKNIFDCHFIYMYFSYCLYKSLCI